MSDTLTRVKLQLRPVNGSVLNGNTNGDDKTPTSPASKLLINHGKPNYTISRSPKAQQNGGMNPLNHDLQNNNRNNYYPYKSAGVVGTTGIVTNGYNSLKKVNATNNYNNNGGGGSSNSSQNGDDLVIQSTKFNGVFKAANSQQQNENSSDEFESKVVLRRVQRQAEATSTHNGNDENVPEFILRQRRIQERLAKENLDFENRRSGYFTHVVISPTSPPNRTSMMETMSSPPIVPSLEMPPPAKEESIVEESSVEVGEAGHEASGEEQVHVENGAAETQTNGGSEEEEVAKAIEEVNKAVAGEVDDEKVDVVEEAQPAGGEKEAENAEVVVEEEKIVIVEHKVEEHKEEKVEEEEVKKEEHNVEELKEEEHKEEAHEEVEQKEVEHQHVDEVAKIQEPETPTVSIVVTSAPLEEVEPTQDSETSAVKPEESITAEATAEHEHKEDTTEVVVVHSEVTVEAPKSVEVASDPQPIENGQGIEIATTNGHSTEEEVTISHTNGLTNGVSSELITPCLPKPDPSGALGVNYEPKTVVSFSRDLGAPNNYPDTVQVVKTHEEGGEVSVESSAASDELKEMAKLKFDIKADDKDDVQVTSVLRTAD